MVGASLTFTTVKLKAAKLALKVPSLTLITMPLVTPTLLLVGVPVNAPVALLKLAQLGLLLMLYTRVVPVSISAPVGVKLYATSWLTLVLGVPLMVGASLTFTTVRLKAAKLALNVPSLTLITMPE